MENGGPLARAGTNSTLCIPIISGKATPSSQKGRESPGAVTGAGRAVGQAPRGIPDQAQV
ncbi:hypothetical protein GCM10020001_009650 [Nonomuraea salmonea]